MEETVWKKTVGRGRTRKRARKDIWQTHLYGRAVKAALTVAQQSKCYNKQTSEPEAATPRYLTLFSLLCGAFKQCLPTFSMDI